MRRQWSSISSWSMIAAVAASVLGVSAAGRAAPGRPAPAALQRLQIAGQQLEAARQRVRVAPGKEADLREQAALDVYNAAREAAFGSQVGTNSAQGSFDGTMPEVEPNNDIPGATSLDSVILREGSAVVVGEIRVAGDQDNFSFTAPAGARVWAYADSGGPQSAGGTSRDTVLSLIGTDQSTVLESEDDNGTGNGRDATIETGLASVIAGRALPGAGTYFLRVRAFSGTAIIAPYRLYVVLTTEGGVNETEPNESPGTANTVLSVGGRIGLVSGTVAGADGDIYRLALQAGDVATLQLDEDPGRDGTVSGCELGLLDPAGALLLNDSDVASVATPSGQGFGFRAVTSGVYFVRVKQAAAVAATDYTLMTAVHTRSVGAGTVINGALGSGSVDYPSISGTQVGRLNRNGVVSNCDAPPKPYPGLISDSGHLFDAYLFKNRSGEAACVTVTLTSFDSIHLFAPTYSTFDPGNLSTGYLADAGNSTITMTPFSYSLRVEPGAVFVVAVAEVTTGGTGKTYQLTLGGDSIRSSLVGCPANMTVPNTPNLAGAIVNYNTPGVTDPSLGPVVCSPASGSFFPLGDTVVTCRDQAGNSCSFTVTVKDVQAPTVTCPNSLTVNLSQPNGAVVNYNASAADNSGALNLVCTPVPGTVFPLGNTLVTCTATDAAGNTATCSFTITVQDTVAPVITCPDAVTVNQDRPTGALVTYAASASDNSGSVNFTASPSSGTVFPLGATVVTCTATDPAGNKTVRTFLVTVKDTQAPVVTCPASVTAVQNLAGGAMVGYTVTASDNAGSVNLTCSPASGSFFPLGTTTVTCVGVDTSGNVTTCTFAVTVNAPSSTAGAKVSGSGTIANGSPAAKFKITASVAATGAPKLTFTHTQTGQALKNSSVSAIVKSGTGVKIFGKLRNGKTGPEQDFLLEVRDVAKPGAAKDTYRLSVKGGFQLAETTIATGEITVK